MRSPCFLPIASIRLTTSAIDFLGTAISSRIESELNRASAGSEQRRAYKSASAAAISAASVTPRQPCEALAISAILLTLCSIETKSPSSPNSKSAPALVSKPRWAKSSTATRQVLSKNSRVAGRIPAVIIFSTAPAAAAKSSKYATPYFDASGRGASATVISVKTASVPSLPTSNLVTS